MGIFERQIEGLFKDVPGGRAFYPGGRFGRGYLVGPEQEKSLKRIRARTLWAILVAMVGTILWMLALVLFDLSSRLPDEDDFGYGNGIADRPAALLPPTPELLGLTPILPFLLILLADWLLVRRQLWSCPQIATTPTGSGFGKRSFFARRWGCCKALPPA